MQGSKLDSQTPSFTRTPIATGVVLALASPALMAQDDSFAIEEVVVTAQKRSENMQDVPISIQALGNQQLEELNLMNFVDYTKMLPSVAMEFNGTSGAGTSFSLIYMRGISTGGDGQATTSLPSVGMYLDELPMTTIQGNMDVHMYDIARVEALAGPQGTLYGASSQAGTIRIITNKPDPSGFSANISAQADLVDGDDTGGVIEGYVNIPIGDSAAVRLVGWSRSDAGWVDNVAGDRVFYGVNNCAPGDTSCDADDIYQSTNGEDNYNTIDTTGARAALRVDLGDNWTITPTLMYQKSEGNGSWGDDLNDIGVSGKNAVRHTLPEFTEDEWSMLGLTIEGSIGNFDVVYAGSYLEREVEGSFDYADYSYWYDAIYTTGYYSDLHFSDDGNNAGRAFPNYFVPNYFDPADVGSRVMSGARYTNDDRYTKNNHEIRISTDPDKSIRGMIGFFTQKQFHDFEQHWIVEGISPVMWLDYDDQPNNEAYRDTVYLNSMYRTDRDDAIFGSVDFDIGEKTTLTLGARFFEPEVHVQGFFGFGENWQGGTLGSTWNLWSGTGEQMCDLVEGQPGWTPAFNGQENWKNKPCLNVDKKLSESDSVFRVNLQRVVGDDSMIYFTWSEGYRPGGVQRAPLAGEYLSDFLTNYEFGWKTQWADNTIQFNGAIFHEEWDDFQVSFTGDNAITAVNNGPTAHVDGIEADLLWLPSENLRISAAVAFYDTELQDDYCNFTAGICTEVLAPKGTPLPVTAEFKGNLIARYHFNIGSLDSYVQGAVAHNGSRLADMDLTVAPIIGELPAWTTLDISAGISRNAWALDLFISNATNEDAPLYKTAECTLETCGPQIYGVRHRPTTVSLRASFDFE